jgi:hypothetical protein
LLPAGGQTGRNPKAKSCRRFVQDAKLIIDELFQNALSHKEDKWRFPYARDAIHSDRRLGVKGVGSRTMVSYEQTV